MEVYARLYAADFAGRFLHGRGKPAGNAKRVVGLLLDPRPFLYLRGVMEVKLHEARDRR